jgi:periplasmic copper chaperone A
MPARVIAARGGRRGEAGFMATGGLVAALGAWLFMLGRGPIAADTDGRPQVRITGAYLLAASHEIPVYFTLRNGGDGADRLLGIRTDVSTIVMMHHGTRMDTVDTVAVPAHESVAFTPNGPHVMIMDPRQALRPGIRVRLTLLFSRSDPQTVSAPVLAQPPND